MTLEIYRGNPVPIQFGETSFGDALIAGVGSGLGFGVADMVLGKVAGRKKNPRITRHSARKMSDDELLYAHKDLTEVIEVQEHSRRFTQDEPAGMLGVYWDEIAAVGEELRRRGLHLKTRPMRYQKNPRKKAWRPMQAFRTLSEYLPPGHSNVTLERLRKKKNLTYQDAATLIVKAAEDLGYHASTGGKLIYIQRDRIAQRGSLRLILKPQAMHKGWTGQRGSLSLNLPDRRTWARDEAKTKGFLMRYFEGSPRDLPSNPNGDTERKVKVGRTIVGTAFHMKYSGGWAPALLVDGREKYLPLERTWKDAKAAVLKAHRALKRNPAPRRRKTTRGRLGSSVMATGVVWYDRSREEHGDYVTVARLSFRTLKLTINKGVSKAMAVLIRAEAARIQAKKGEQYEVSWSGQTVELGSNPFKGSLQRGQKVHVFDPKSGTTSGVAYTVKASAAKSVTVHLPGGANYGKKFAGKSFRFSWDGVGYKRQGEYLAMDRSANPRVIVVNPTGEKAAFLQKAEKKLRRKLTKKERADFDRAWSMHRNFHGVDPDTMEFGTVPDGTPSRFLLGVGIRGSETYDVRNTNSARKGAWVHESGDNKGKKTKRTKIAAYANGKPTVDFSPPGSRRRFNDKLGMLG